MCRKPWYVAVPCTSSHFYADLFTEFFRAALKHTLWGNFIKEWDAHNQAQKIRRAVIDATSVRAMKATKR